MVNPKWRLKFNGGNPVWLDEDDVIVRYATQIEIYEKLTLEGRKYAYEHMNENERKFLAALRDPYIRAVLKHKGIGNTNRTEEEVQAKIQETLRKAEEMKD